MAIVLHNVPVHLNSITSPTKINTTSTVDSYFNIVMQAVTSTGKDSSMSGKDGDYLATIALQNMDYDLSLLPPESIAVPVILGYVNKSDMVSFRFTTAIPNYDQQDFRRPYITKLELNATQEFLDSQSSPLVILETYLLVISITGIA